MRMRLETIGIYCVIVIATITACSGQKKIHYDDLYDPIADVGQYKIPAIDRTPKLCWEITPGIDRANLKEAFLAASITGLTARALQQNKTDVGVWIEQGMDSRVAYQKERASLESRGCRFFAKATPRQLATETFEAVDGIDVTLKTLFDGYILTDLRNNPESGTVAVTASHIYNGIIVDREDR
ncbi:MAG: hypothetical protein LBQ39_07985, partial [Tannerellaceae bacterium]|nr:hypothetical protein [Tannerellaceae bacterium]